MRKKERKLNETTSPVISFSQLYACHCIVEFALAVSSRGQMFIRHSNFLFAVTNSLTKYMARDFFPLSLSLPLTRFSALLFVPFVTRRERDRLNIGRWRESLIASLLTQMKQLFLSQVYWNAHANGTYLHIQVTRDWSDDCFSELHTLLIEWGKYVCTHTHIERKKKCKLYKAQRWRDNWITILLYSTLSWVIYFSKKQSNLTSLRKRGNAINCMTFGKLVRIFHSTLSTGDVLKWLADANCISLAHTSWCLIS